MVIIASTIKNGFKYETHMHTKEASACATGTGAEMARAYYEQGYTGIIVTDHFLNGNTTIREKMPWEKKIEKFCRGYENARNEGEKIGLTVFFGWEYAYRETEFLTYGLDKEFLLANPDMLSWPLDKYFDRVHSHGGFLSHAHPFREASYIRKIRLFPDKVDAVEVFNGGHNDLYNVRATEYAEKHGLLMTSGSDAHHTGAIFTGGMVFAHELHTIQQFIETVKGDKDGYRLSGHTTL